MIKEEQLKYSLPGDGDEDGDEDEDEEEQQ